ncbi:MAG: S41 family peptidase [Pseudomonadota bacterium]
MIIRSVFSYRILAVGLIATATACGGGSQDNDTDATAADNPVVGVQTALCDSRETTARNTTDSDDCESTDTTPTLSPNTETTGSVQASRFNVYKVPTDSQVILTSSRGNADLYLYDSIDFNDNNLLCSASKPFLEDVCSASVDEGSLYAVVYGTQATDYRLTTSDDCSIESINRWVYRNMKDYYLYADQVPTVNTDTYATPAELISELRFEELDPFSGISNAERREAFFNTGLSYGFGYNWRYDANNNARVTYVFANSSFGRANIKRGDIIVAVEGELWNDMTRERYLELVGNKDNPRTTNWTFIDSDTQSTKDVLLTYGEYTADTVLYTNIYTNDSFDGKVGYIVFNEFLATSEAELDSAIARLSRQGATELILDLRYNPGGYTYIARKLASQIGGETLQGKALVRYEHNSKYSNVDYQRNFEAATPTLNLNKVVILTTSSTASSSELLINALRPYVEVVTIGGSTRGKPFISSSRNYCGLSLNAMEAQGVNANGVSVAGGIPADCYATDDPTRPFGIQNGEPEGMLNAALDYYHYGTCDVGPAIAKRSIQSGNTATHSPDQRFRQTPGSTH